MTKIEPIKNVPENLDLEGLENTINASHDSFTPLSMAKIVETFDLAQDVKSVSTVGPGPIASDGTKFYLQDDGTVVNVEGISYEEYTKKLNEARTVELENNIEEIRLEELRQTYPNSTGEFELTLNNQAYDLSADEIKLLESVVAAEAINDYDDALAVVSVILNRCDEGNWGGSDPISVITAKGQFAAYFDGYYEKYYDDEVEIPDAVIQAVEDGLSGVRNNDFLEFRSSTSTTFLYQVADGGNKYGHEML